LNNYLFLGLFLGVAIIAGVGLFLAAPKDDIFFDNYGLGSISGEQDYLQKLYYEGKVDRAGNPINNKATSNTTGNYTLPKIDVPPSAQVNAAYYYNSLAAQQEEQYEP
jgi:hypothetical protein